MPPTLGERLKDHSGRGPLPDDVQEQIVKEADAELAAEEAARAAAAKGDDAPLETDKAKPEEGEQKPADDAKPKEEAPEATEDEKAAQAAQKAKDDAILAKKDEELEPEEKTRKAELVTAQEDVILAKKDDELTAEEKTQKVEILKARDEAALTEEVKALAASEKMTEDEARKVVEAEKKIIERSGADPKKLARQLRTTQSAYSRLETTIKAERERAANVLGDDEVVIGGKKVKWEDAREVVVTAYREKNPEKTAALTDDQVLGEAKAEYQGKVKEAREAHGKQLIQAATDKRTKLVSELPDSAKPYKAAIEEALKNVSDAQIVDSEYDPEDLISWARGQYLTDAKIKEIEDAAFLRGKQNAKILGEKPPAGGGGDGGAGGGGKGADADVASLSQEQKDRALSMYEGIAVWDEKEKYRQFVSYLKEVGEWPVKK